MVPRGHNRALLRSAANSEDALPFDGGRVDSMPLFMAKTQSPTDSALAVNALLTTKSSVVQASLAL